MRQHLGQHFLKNQAALTTIINALDLCEGETIIEIGPGAGALTLPLAGACAEKNCKLIAIEKDGALASKLTQQLTVNNEQLTEMQIIKGDALQKLPSLVNGQLSAVNCKIVGNIPYYITGALLRLLGELERKPLRTVLMIQKEVAERVSSIPPKMNLLAAATQVWAQIELLAILKPSDFDPPPEVESAIIRLTPVNPRTKFSVGVNPRNFHPEAYYRTIHAVFKQPRKKLRNNIAPEILKKAGISPDVRGQNLGVEELIKLSTVIY